MEPHLDGAVPKTLDAFTPITIQAEPVTSYLANIGLQYSGGGISTLGTSKGIDNPISGRAAYTGLTIAAPTTDWMASPIGSVAALSAYTKPSGLTMTVPESVRLGMDSLAFPGGSIEALSAYTKPAGLAVKLPESAGLGMISLGGTQSWRSASTISVGSPGVAGINYHSAAGASGIGTAAFKHELAGTTPSSLYGSPLSQSHAATLAIGSGLDSLLFRKNESATIAVKPIIGGNACSATQSALRFDALSGALILAEDVIRTSPSALTVQSLSCLATSAAGISQWQKSPAFLSTLTAPTPWALPIREQFVSSDLISALIQPGKLKQWAGDRATVAAEIEDHIDVTLPPALRQIAPGVFKMWKGAWLAFRSSNPDKARQALASVRELLTCVLDTLAPDGPVMAWVPNASDETYVHKGKPTRRARLEFLARNLGPADLGKYISSDLRVHIRLFKELNAGTHGWDDDLSDAQIDALLRKAHSMVCSIVEMYLIGRR